VNYWATGDGDAAGCVSVSVILAAWAVVSSTCLYLAGLLIAKCAWATSCCPDWETKTCPCAGAGAVSLKMESVGHGETAVISSGRTMTIFCCGDAAEFANDLKTSNGEEGAEETRNDCLKESGDAREAGRAIPLGLVRDLDRHPGYRHLAREEVVGIVVSCI
jgi:hypothetical protein